MEKVSGLPKIYPRPKKKSNGPSLEEVLSGIRGENENVRSVAENLSKDLPDMSTFCDWLSETLAISVFDSFFRNYISIVLLFFYCL